MRSRRRNFIERGLSTLVLPYRCRRCYFRFFRTQEPHQQPVSSPVVHGMQIEEQRGLTSHQYR
jgi:predicted Zn-ribbon and HTH transcriptional regulator